MLPYYIEDKYNMVPWWGDRFFTIVLRVPQKTTLLGEYLFKSKVDMKTDYIFWLVNLSKLFQKGLLSRNLRKLLNFIATTNALLCTTYLYKYNLENKSKPVLRTVLITWSRISIVNKQYNLIISWNSIYVRKSS